MNGLSELTCPQVRESVAELDRLPSLEAFQDATNYSDDIPPELDKAVKDLNSSVGSLHDDLANNDICVDRYAGEPTEEHLQEVELSMIEVEQGVTAVVEDLTNLQQRLAEFQQSPAAQQVPVTAAMLTQVEQLTARLTQVQNQTQAHSVDVDGLHDSYVKEFSRNQVAPPSPSAPESSPPLAGPSAQPFDANVAGEPVARPDSNEIGQRTAGREKKSVIHKALRTGPYTRERGNPYDFHFTPPGSSPLAAPPIRPSSPPSDSHSPPRSGAASPDPHTPPGSPAGDPAHKRRVR